MKFHIFHSWELLNKVPIDVERQTRYGAYECEAFLIISKCKKCGKLSAYTKSVDGYIHDVDIDFIPEKYLKESK